LKSRCILLRRNKESRYVAWVCLQTAAPIVNRPAKNVHGGSDFTYSSQRILGGTSGITDKNRFRIPIDTRDDPGVACLIGYPYTADGIE